MKTLIVCTSASHGNTRRIAEVIGQALDARIVDSAQVSPAELASYDLVGFGSGIQWMSFHPQLVKFVESLPEGQQRKAFVFSTSGMPETPFRRYSRGLAGLLEGKGFTVLDTFTCRGLDTMGPLKLVGGINQGRPNDSDLEAARVFADKLRAQLS